MDGLHENDVELFVVYRWCAQPEEGRADRGDRRKGDRNEETGIAGG